MAVEIESVHALRERVGQEVAVSDWLEVAQERIDRFADATDDRQWIHVDPERARRESLYGTTIAHGFLTVSLLPGLMQQAIQLRSGVKMGINMGLHQARFLRPVPSGARLRARFTLASLEDVPMGAQAVWSVTLEVEGEQRPCATAEWLVRYLR